MQALTVLRLMIRRLLIAIALVGAVAVRADDSFSKSLSAEDFKAAGLDKLSPGELSRLDALVRGQQAGAVIKATQETQVKVEAKVREQVQAEDRAAAQKQASTGLIDRVKVLLKPGTEIDYTTLDATLPPGYSGWHRGSLLTLTNGQQWVVTETGSDYTNPTGKPVHVRIVPSTMGGFFMEIEGGGRVRVKFLGNLAPAAQAPQR